MHLKTNFLRSWPATGSLEVRKLIIPRIIQLKTAGCNVRFLPARNQPKKVQNSLERCLEQLQFLNLQTVFSKNLSGL